MHANPHDTAAWGVYGDQLQEASDPHGALLALQAAGKGPEVTAFIQEHGLLGGVPVFNVKWEHGFLADASVETKHLRKLAELPASRFLRTLRLTGGGRKQDPIAAIAKVGPLPSLRAVHMSVDEPDWTALADACPRLEHLAVAQWRRPLNDVLRTLQRHPLLARLDRLTLAGPHDDLIGLLSGEAFAHLTEIDLGHDEPDAAMRIMERVPNARVASTSRAEDWRLAQREYSAFLEPCSLETLIAVLTQHGLRLRTADNPGGIPLISGRYEQDALGFAVASPWVGWIAERVAAHTGAAVRRVAYEVESDHSSISSVVSRDGVEADGSWVLPAHTPTTVNAEDIFDDYDEESYDGVDLREYFYDDFVAPVDDGAPGFLVVAPDGWQPDGLVWRLGDLELNPAATRYLTWRLAANDVLDRSRGPDLSRWRRRAAARLRLSEEPEVGTNPEYDAELARLADRDRRTVSTKTARIAGWKLNTPGDWVLMPEERTRIRQALRNPVRWHTATRPERGWVADFRRQLDGTDEIELSVRPASG